MEPSNPETEHLIEQMRIKIINQKKVISKQKESLDVLENMVISCIE